MRKLLTLLLLLLLLLTSSAMAAEKSAYRLADEQGTLLAWLDVPPAVGDVLLTADGTRHRVIAVEGQQAVLREDGTETLPDVPWSARETAQPVTSAVRTIGLMGDAALVRDLREGLANQGAALVTVNPEQADFPLTVAQDEISNSAEYDTLLSGEKAAKIRLIVRRVAHQPDGAHSTGHRRGLTTPPRHSFGTCTLPRTRKSRSGCSGARGRPSQSACKTRFCRWRR